MHCSVDGETVQASNTSDLVFDPVALITYASQIITLQPGDVIATGRSPRTWFAAGTASPR
jgi:acylpyruvate hydrolase